MKQEADRLIFSRVSVEAGREEGGGGSGELGWGGKGEGVYFTNEDTRAFTYAWTYREETGGINHTSPEHAFSLTLLSWKATVYLLIASTRMVKTKQKW